MKNLIKKIAISIILGFTIISVKGQTFEISVNNTQTCSGITATVYNVLNVPLVSNVAMPNGTATCVVTSCTGGTPAYVIFNDGTCNVTVNVNTTYTCNAGGTPPCNCTCISAGTSYQVNMVTITNCGTCNIDLQITIQ